MASLSLCVNECESQVYTQPVNSSFIKRMNSGGSGPRPVLLQNTEWFRRGEARRGRTRSQNQPGFSTRITATWEVKSSVSAVGWRRLRYCRSQVDETSDCSSWCFISADVRPVQITDVTMEMSDRRVMEVMRTYSVCMRSASQRGLDQLLFSVGAEEEEEVLYVLMFYHRDK